MMNKDDGLVMDIVLTDELVKELRTKIEEISIMGGQREIWVDRLVEWGDIKKITQLITYMMWAVGESKDPANRCTAKDKTAELNIIYKMVMKRLKVKTTNNDEAFLEVAIPKDDS